MKPLIYRFSNLLHNRWIIATLLVMFSFSVYGIYKYFNPDLYRIPSDPNNAEEINFFALGDQGSGNLEQRAVADAMEKVANKDKKLDFVVLLGDNFYIDRKLHEDSIEWNSMFEKVYTGTYLSTVPFYAILGNHDKDLSTSAITHPEIEYSKKGLGSNRWRMPAHFFHMDFGNINGRPLLRIVYLDTNSSIDEMSLQANYLREQFTNNPIQPLWKIVAGHHTIRSCGKHFIGRANLIDNLLPALKEAKVDIYLSGHDHNQQLIVTDKEPLYVINGSGGRSLYSQKIHSEDLRFFNKNYGFVKLNLNANRLAIEFYDKQAQKVSSHILNHNCNDLRSKCIEEVK